MRAFQTGIFASCAVLLSGCAVEVISSSPRTVVVRAGDARIKESQDLADKECAKHSRYARLAQRPTSDTAEFIFDCVE